jgi:hypothetical protein
MKRLNSETKEPFRRGDIREDGYVFFAYTKRKRRDDFYVEIWLSPEASRRALVNDRERHRRKARGHRVQHASSDT